MNPIWNHRRIGIVTGLLAIGVFGYLAFFKNLKP